MSEAQAGGERGCPTVRALPDIPHGCFAAPPEMDESTCPSHQTWLEGAEASALACAARGRPSPGVLCSREGTPWPEQQRVSREDAGIYHCVATNAHGTDSRTVTVGVECEWGQHWMEGTQPRKNDSQRWEHSRAPLPVPFSRTGNCSLNQG